jgi:deoxycytidylate deaminase
MINSKAIVLGFTAPFGSGCSTAAQELKVKKGFHYVKLSSVIRKEWQVLHQNQTPTRSDLQKLGNELRVKNKNPGILVQKCIEDLEALPDKIEKIAIDGIRNLGEIKVLQNTFQLRFYLFAIQCKQSERWERIRASEYEPNGLTEQHFAEDNERDRDQETVYGQQVQLCIDQADVFIDNDDIGIGEFREKVIGYTELVTGEKPRYARTEEIMMNLAYSTSHGSKCLKRQVGALLVEAEIENDEITKVGDIVGLGFNENPRGTSPCVEEKEYGADPAKNIPGSCYRDIVRYDFFKKQAEKGTFCPACAKKLQIPTTKRPPWLCVHCNVDLEGYFWPERAMTKCTAVHAEVQAILSARERAKGTVLFTTTFPCFQCAEQIAQSGIRYVVYTETYPDLYAANRLEIAGIKVTRFEGVRASRFDEIFSKARPYIAEVIRAQSFV